MTTPEFALRLVCVQPGEKERIAWLEEFLKYYDVTEKKPLPPILNAELQLKQSEIQQSLLGKLPDGRMS